MVVIREHRTYRVSLPVFFFPCSHQLTKKLFPLLLLFSFAATRPALGLRLGHRRSDFQLQQALRRIRRLLDVDDLPDGLRKEHRGGNRSGHLLRLWLEGISPFYRAPRPYLGRLYTREHQTRMAVLSGFGGRLGVRPGVARWRNGLRGRNSPGAQPAGQIWQPVLHQYVLCAGAFGFILCWVWLVVVARTTNTHS